MQPEQRRNSCSHDASDWKPTAFLHQLNFVGKLRERQRFGNADTHESAKDALMQEMSCKVHSGDCCHDQDECENCSSQISQRSSILRWLNSFLNDQLFNCDQHHEQETGGDHHVTGRWTGWCLTCSFGLIQRRSSKRRVNLCFVYPPVRPIFRQNPEAKEN